MPKGKVNYDEADKVFNSNEEQTFKPRSKQGVARLNFDYTTKTIQHKNTIQTTKNGTIVNDIAK